MNKPPFFQNFFWGVAFLYYLYPFVEEPTPYNFNPAASLWGKLFFWNQKGTPHTPPVGVFINTEIFKNQDQLLLKLRYNVLQKDFFMFNFHNLNVKCV